MKKSELTHIIRAIVAEEVRKQLPQALSEVFSNMMGTRGVVTERQAAPAPQVEPEEEPSSFKQSLSEMLNTGEPPQQPAARPAPPAKRHYTKNATLNEILNQTSPFSGIARQQMGGMSSAVAMAAAMSSIPTSTPNMGEIVDEDSPSLRRMPTMQGANSPSVSAIPEVMVDQTVSALDVKHIAPPAVKDALSRNYSSLMKAIDKKKKGVMAQ